MKALLLVLFVCVAAPVHADDHLLRISEAVAIVGHGADLASTQHCLGAGRCRELNPWLARYNNPVGFAVAKMGVASVGLWATSKIPNKTLAAIVNFGIGSGFLMLSVHNTKVGK